MTSGWITRALQWQVFNNTVEAYGLALAVFAGVLLGLLVVKRVVLVHLQRLAQRTSTDIGDFVVSLIRAIGPAVSGVIALYFATRSLVVAPSLAQLLHVALVLVLTFKGIFLLQAASVFFLSKWTASADQADPTNASIIRNIAKALTAVLWAGGLLFILDNLGVNVTSVIAGLGIGGVAVALAAQTILGDAFSSFAIFLDKPFRVGDFIIVGDLMGTVEHVGFKTTRIRSLGGEQLIFSNSDLTSSRIRNYKRMDTRRVVFKLGVVYQTALKQTQAIPAIIREVIGEQPEGARCDRVHFQSFGDFALIYEVVYYVLSADYNVYMDVQQQINFRIKEEFERAGIEFAYPTQQLYVTAMQPSQPA